MLLIILAGNTDGPWPTTGSKFEVVKKIYEETIQSSNAGKKMIIDMTKIVIPGDLTDLTDGFVGYKNNTEETLEANSYVAFRCPDANDCVKIPFR